MDTANNLGALYTGQYKIVGAEATHPRVLQGCENAWGVEYMNMVNNLGALYADQGWMAEAEAVYLQALQEHESAVGADRPRTRVIAHDLSALRTDERGEGTRIGEQVVLDV
jgi:hypothetical protein